MKSPVTQYKRHRFPPEINQYVVWRQVRFNLSHRETEALLTPRGIVSHEPIRLDGEVVNALLQER